MDIIEHAPAPTAAFDFAVLGPALAKSTRARTDRIVATYRQTVEGFAEIGRELCAARDELEHGHFLRWIETLPLSRSSAYRAMDVADNLGSVLPIVGNLPLTVVQKLASAPDPVRIGILNRLNTAEAPTARVISNELLQAQQEAKREAAEAELSPEKVKQRKAREKARREREKREQAEREVRLAEAEELRQAHARRAAELIRQHMPDDAITELFGLLNHNVGVYALRLALSIAPGAEWPTSMSGLSPSAPYSVRADARRPIRDPEPPSPVEVETDRSELTITERLRVSRSA